MQHISDVHDPAEDLSGCKSAFAGEERFCRPPRKTENDKEWAEVQAWKCTRRHTAISPRLTLPASDARFAPLSPE